MVARTARTTPKGSIVTQYIVRNGRVVEIVTDHQYPPIPIRAFDWVAYCDGWEPGDPYGEGPTEEAAIAALREAVE
jgi:hypothetical protein